jgi:Cft2 family RNA processing exonuclease
LRRRSDVGRARLLADCGMFRRGRVAAGRNAARRPFRPAQLDFVVLTHAHGDGRLPALNPVVDSPRACEVSEIGRRHVERFDEEARNPVTSVRGKPGQVHLRDAHAAATLIALNRIVGGAVIVAAGGWCSAGRVRLTCAAAWRASGLPC